MFQSVNKNPEKQLHKAHLDNFSTMSYLEISMNDVFLMAVLDSRDNLKQIIGVYDTSRASNLGLLIILKKLSELTKVVCGNLMDVF